jgi:hypothetical protein
VFQLGAAVMLAVMGQCGFLSYVNKPPSVFVHNARFLLLAVSSMKLDCRSAPR